ncbi:MAG: ATP-binding protein [Candidatus Methanoplasma sp.]|jgi:predicted AAA+ superfamily ATPase|nr:ATP-binding protein [Candidatus Methanoplasma sp.]
MQRVIYDDLIKWKEDRKRKPLIMGGVRQCGKTYILEEFGKNNYDGVAYLNFEKAPEITSIFETDLEPHRIIGELGLYLGKAILPGRTLIIFDEIQACGNAITSLKYFCEDAPEYHVVCAGSLLGIRLSKPRSFPVGKVDFMDMYPLNFYEFLLANGEDMLCGHLKNKNAESKLTSAVVSKLEMYLRHYLSVGGMPEAVAEWTASNNIEKTEKILRAILRSYADDFSKYASKDINELTMIWRSIPEQLSKENRRFIFSHVKTGKRARDLEHALEWLISAGLIHKVCMISRPSVPLSAYSDENMFKIYFCDVGLLRILAGVPTEFLFKQSDEYAQFKGAVAENFVLNEMKVLGKDPYYWRSEGKAEVDFIDMLGTKIVPIEVKAETNTRSKSLAEYIRTYGPETAVKVSMNPPGGSNGIVAVPLYMVWKLEEILSGIDPGDRNDS